MNEVLYSEDTDRIENLINVFLHLRFENMSNKRNRFLKLFESDARFQFRQLQTSKMKRNLVETQRVLKVIINDNNVKTQRKKKNI